MDAGCIIASLLALQRLQPKPSPQLLLSMTSRLADMASQLTPSQDCQVMLFPGFSRPTNR
jgi:hypothetical protein